MLSTSVMIASQLRLSSQHLDVQSARHMSIYWKLSHCNHCLEALDHGRLHNPPTAVRNILVE